MAQGSLQDINAIADKLKTQEFMSRSAPERVEWLESALASAHSTQQRYAITRLQAETYFQNRDFKRALAICKTVRIIPEDLRFRYSCADIRITLEGLNPEEDRKEFYDLLQMARNLKDFESVCRALRAISWSHSQEGNITEAWAALEEALSLSLYIPEIDRFDIASDLAANYYQYGDTEYVHKGIKLLDDSKSLANKLSLDKNAKDLKLYQNFSRFASYNMGIGYALHLHDYEKAIPQFVEAAEYDFTRVDALTFAALSAAEIGRYEAAKGFLAEIKGEQALSAVRTNYLKCYQALASHHWDRAVRLAPCFQLTIDTPLEVSTDIYQRLAALKDQAEELQALRAFMSLYQEKINPEYRKKSTKGASKSELKRLENETKLKDEKIALGERIKQLLYVVLVISILLLCLVLGILRSRRIIKLQSKDLQTQKLNLQHILDNIDEGIISIDHSAKISHVYSRHAIEILEQKPDQFSVAALLAKIGLKDDFLAEALQMFSAVLNEDAISWDLNVGLLPLSGFIGNRPYQFYWTPIISEDKVDEIILSMRDASATLALEKEAKTRSAILTLVKAGVVGQNFVSSLEQRLQDLRPYIVKNGWDQGLRVAHTLKGEARGLGFADLQDQLHHFEQGMLEENAPRSIAVLESMQETARAFLEALNLIKEGDGGESSNPILPLVQAVLGDAGKRLRESGFGFSADTHLDWVDVTVEEVVALRDVLIHGVANAIDHGYLRPRNSQQVCDSIARLSIQMHLKGDDIHFAIIDHGIGIDWKALEEIARKRQWTPPEGGDLTDIVFQDQVSTIASNQVSKTSGRGIGMAAVAEAMKSLQGTIKLSPGEQSRGTRLDAKWNHQRVLAAKTKAIS